MGEILWVTLKTEGKDQMDCFGKADGGTAALLLMTDLDYRPCSATLNSTSGFTVAPCMTDF